jgi:hypothetical protein
MRKKKLVLLEMNFNAFTTKKNINLALQFLRLINTGNPKIPLYYRKLDKTVKYFQIFSNISKRIKAL